MLQPWDLLGSSPRPTSVAIPAPLGLHSWAYLSCHPGLSWVSIPKPVLLGCTSGSIPEGLIRVATPNPSGFTAGSTLGCSPGLIGVPIPDPSGVSPKPITVAVLDPSGLLPRVYLQFHLGGSLGSMWLQSQTHSCCNHRAIWLAVLGPSAILGSSGLRPQTHMVATPNPTGCKPGPTWTRLGWLQPQTPLVCTPGSICFAIPGSLGSQSPTHLGCSPKSISCLNHSSSPSDTVTL